MKRRYFIIAIVVFGVLAACEQKPTEQKPVLDQQQFIDVLTDVRILEGYYSARYERVDSSKGRVSEYYNQLFEHHHITREQFEQSFTYYNTHFDEMNVIEEKVMEKLSALVADDRQHNPVETYKTDSLNKAGGASYNGRP